MKRSSTCRLRKVICADCGYTARIARSWMDVGLPTCPCGSEMRPESPADLAYVGLIGQDDVPAPMWTAICRENGWEDLIVRKGAAAKSWSERRKAIRTARADHCIHPSCGLWVPNGADVCSAGHAQGEDVEPEAMAF